MARRRLVEYEFSEITKNDANSLFEWYAVYERCFPDKNEREDHAQFLNILQMNDDETAQKRFGPWKEAIFAIRDVKTRNIVGGLNFGMTWCKEMAKAAHAVSVQVPFLFVDPAFRKQDEQETLVITTGPVLAEIRKWVDHRLAESAPGLRGKGILIFFEANNPRKMDEAERRLDKSNAQIDPWLRYKLWLEFARPLAFDYVQPPLQPGKQSVKYLDLFCMALGGAGASARSRPKEEGISPALLLHHLRCFCSMSVLKKRSADEEESFRRMRDKLVSCIQTNGLVPFVADDDGRIQEIKRRAEANRNIEISARKAWRSLHALAATDAAFRSRLDDPPSLSEGPMDIFFQMLGRC
jgi:hypothetical protein